MSRLGNASSSSKPVRPVRLGSCSSGTASSAVVAARGMLTAVPKHRAGGARPVAGELDTAAFDEAMRDPSIRRQFRELETQAASASESEVKAAMRDPDILRHLRELGLKDQSAHHPGSVSKPTVCTSPPHSAYPCDHAVPEVTRHTQSRHLPKPERAPEDILEEMLREAERSASPIQADSGVDGLVQRVAQRLTADVHEDAIGIGELEPENCQSISRRCRQLQDMLREELEM
eukprot:TRINITY_DN75421_c0_g1_i1.p1 TRINITY_DN75421_c0_g1~~TRINITY_DN75421_c0_g1_i1.p1  ORF type:complete len:232 (+),score=37.19 TRINITY_DN75421_c0_g1_i1:122-817(+)